MDVDSLIKNIDSATTDSIYENKLVNLMSVLNDCDLKKLLFFYLDSDKYKFRMLGLRLARRVVLSDLVLEGVIDRCFKVNRFTELQVWYKTILARYPVSKFISKVREQVEKNSHSMFVDKHIRALQLGLAAKRVKRNKKIEELLEYMSMVSE